MNGLILRQFANNNLDVRNYFKKIIKIATKQVDIKSTSNYLKHARFLSYPWHLFTFFRQSFSHKEWRWRISWWLPRNCNMGINSCWHLENKINMMRGETEESEMTTKHEPPTPPPRTEFDDGKSFLILHSKPLISRNINAISIVFLAYKSKTRTTQQQVEIFHHLERIPEVTTGNIYSTDRISLARI